jgi:hypothetical protein
MDVELPHFWTLKSTVRLPEQEVIVASKSTCIFRSLALVAPLLVSLVLAAPNDEESVLKSGRLFAKLEPSRYPTSRPATSANWIRIGARRRL